MRQKQTSTMVCTRHSWVTGDTVEWFGSTVRHGNERRVVQNFCGGTCEFPACLEQAVLPPEAEEPTIHVSADNRIREENWSHARSLFDERDPK